MGNNGEFKVICHKLYDVYRLHPYDIMTFDKLIIYLDGLELYKSPLIKKAFNYMK